MKQKNVPIRLKNKKAYFHYNILESQIAGVELMGMDVKLIRSGKASITEAYCNFINNELYISNLHLAERESDRVVVYKNKTQRKLLLKRRDLNKWGKRIVEKGMSIVPLSLFFNDKGYVKIEIALAKGKREYDKRNSLKNAESDRELDRIKKLNHGKIN